MYLIFFSTEAASLTHLKKIKVINVVFNEELQPKAILDLCWKKLLKNKSEDWWSELL